MRQKPIIPPTCEPITLTEAKVFLRVDTDITIDDGLIAGFIATARDHAERWTGRQLVAATFAVGLDCFPACVTLPYSPVLSVESITYTDTDGATQTVSASVYQLDTLGELWKIRPAYNQSWPTYRSQENAVQINFTAGYVTPFSVDVSSNVVTMTNRTPADGDLVRLTNSGGALPAGLSTATNYYCRDSSGHTCKLAATSGGTAIDITGAGTGQHFIGILPDSIRQAMLIHILWQYDRDIRGSHTEEPMAIASYLNMNKDWRAA